MALNVGGHMARYAKRGFDKARAAGASIYEANQVAVGRRSAFISRVTSLKRRDLAKRLADIRTAMKSKDTGIHKITRQIVDQTNTRGVNSTVKAGLLERRKTLVSQKNQLMADASHVRQQGKSYTRQRPGAGSGRGGNPYHDEKGRFTHK